MNYLHSFGDILTYTIPAYIQDTYTYTPNIPFHLDPAHGINLVSLLGPLGLLQHVWVLWEMMVMGMDVVVYAPSPTLVSYLVLSLASLLGTQGSVGKCMVYGI